VWKVLPCHIYEGGGGGVDLLCHSTSLVYSVRDILNKFCLNIKSCSIIIVSAFIRLLLLYHIFYIIFNCIV